MPETSRRTKAWKTWTPSEERTLVTLRREGLSAGEIAQRMGRTYHSISRQAQRMGRVADKKLKQQVYFELLQVVHTIPGVAARMGVRPNTVTVNKSILRRKGYEVGPARRLTKPKEIR
jgi:hypothetical protein